MEWLETVRERTIWGNKSEPNIIILSHPELRVAILPVSMNLPPTEWFFCEFFLGSEFPQLGSVMRSSDLSRRLGPATLWGSDGNSFDNGPTSAKGTLTEMDNKFLLVC